MAFPSGHPQKRLCQFCPCHPGGSIEFALVLVVGHRTFNGPVPTSFGQLSRTDPAKDQMHCKEMPECMTAKPSALNFLRNQLQGTVAAVMQGRTTC